MLYNCQTNKPKLEPEHIKMHQQAFTVWCCGRLSNCSAFRPLWGLKEWGHTLSWQVISVGNRLIITGKLVIGSHCEVWCITHTLVTTQEPLWITAIILVHDCSEFYFCGPQDKNAIKRSSLLVGSSTFSFDFNQPSIKAVQTMEAPFHTLQNIKVTTLVVAH